jgi:transcriptional regulator with XRE-family HTH domain
VRADLGATERALSFPPSKLYTCKQRKEKAFMDATSMSAEQKEGIYFAEQRTSNCVNGKKLKKLRVARKLTLKSVAEETGLSSALISRIENENISPSIETLSKMAKYFGVKISSLFIENDEDFKYEIIRKDERRTITSVVSEKETSNGYFLESFPFRKKSKEMEPFLITLSESVQGDNTYSHEGELFIYVIKGVLELFLENTLVNLEEGDGVYFDASLEHRFRSKYDSEIIALGVKSVNGKEVVFRK